MAGFVAFKGLISLSLILILCEVIIAVSAGLQLDTSNAVVSVSSLYHTGPFLSYDSPNFSLRAAFYFS